MERALVVTAVEELQGFCVLRTPTFEWGHAMMNCINYSCGRVSRSVNYIGV